MTGTDIIEIKRIEKAIKSETFFNRIYTESERSYINSKKNAPQTAAGIFCAKEAVAKALGTGIAKGVTFFDIVVNHDIAGKPDITLTGVALDIFTQKKYKEIGISISHCESYAVAFCVMI